MDQVQTSLVLFFTIVVTNPAPFRGSHLSAQIRSSMSYLPLLLVPLGPCTLSDSKRQEDTFLSEKLVPEMFLFSYCVRRVIWVVCHHSEVAERSDISESIFERYHV